MTHKIQCITEQLADEVAESLRGTCDKTVLGEFEEYGIADTAYNHRMIDERVFNCEQCGWWCPIDEQSQQDSTCCNDCVPDNEEDE